MLFSGSKLLGCPVLSLHVGAPIAHVRGNIIDPDSFKIAAFNVDGPLVGKEAGNLLKSDSVREFSNIGMIIDSVDELVFQKDVVRLDEIMGLDFKLIGLKVVTKKGTKLGKIIDYFVDTDDFSIIQLIVQRPPLKAIIDPELTIPRSEIVEITDRKVVVKSEEDKIRAKSIGKDFVPNFVNPFREPHYAPVQSQTPAAQDKQ